MHFPSVIIDVFIFDASFNRLPVLCVLQYLSDPAKSTNDSLVENQRNK